jgi:hypothetical protein
MTVHDYLCRLFSPENIPNLLLVFVGIITAGFVGWQALETRRSAKAMQDSIRLQEAQMKQSVELGNWKGGEELSYFDDRGSPFLMIEFDIFNPTDHGMTLLGIKWDIGGQQDHIEINALLPAKRGHPTAISYEPNADQIVAYTNKSPLELRVNATVNFTDVMGEMRTQDFGVQFQCKSGIGIVTIRHFDTAAWSSPK